MGEMWYTNLGYDELKRFIKSNIQSMTREFVSVGYYLKYIRDNEMYLEDGYESIWEFAEDQYGIQRTTCSRWMAINDRFSVDGNSPTLAEEYREYSKSQLQEMLYLDDKQMEEVKPDMTVKDIRKIRTPDPVFEEVEEEIPGQMNVEDYPELLPEQKTTVELQKPTEEVYEYLNAFARNLIKLHRNWFLEDYQNRVMDVTTSPILIKQEFCEGRSRTHYFEIREESAFINLFDDYVQVFSVNCDYLGDYDWFYLAAAIQSMWNVIALEEVKRKVEEEKTRADMCDVAQEEQPAVENTNTDCPPGQSSCPRQNWGTSAENQHEGQKECAKCWKRYKELHKDNSASNELNKLEEDTIIDTVAEEIEEDPSDLYEEVSEKTDLDIAIGENERNKRYLKMAEEAFGPKDIRVRTFKVLIAALACYIYELDEVMNPSAEPEQSELPKLKNNEQRKEWLNNYKEWGLWYRDENIDVNYYKYDFVDGSRLVVAEYPQREQFWHCAPRDEHFYHLLEKNREKYATANDVYDRQYTHDTDSETYLVEFLKKIQRGEK